MAIDKGKVLPKLLVKYKGKSVSKNFLEKTAEKYAAKIADEADDSAIDEFINDRDDIIQEAISEGDRRVTEAVNKAKTTKTTETQTEDKGDEFPADMPEWAKQLAKGITTLSGEVTSMKTEGVKKSLTERFQSDERLKGIDPKLLKGRVPTKEDDYEAFVTEAADDLKEFVKDAGAGGVNTSVGKFGKDKPNFANKGGNQQQQQNANVTAAIDNVKKFTATLPGNKAIAKATEV